MTYLDYLIQKYDFKCSMNATTKGVRIRITNSENKVILTKNYETIYDINYPQIDKELRKLLKSPLDIMIDRIQQLDQHKYRVKIRSNYIYITDKSFNSQFWIKLSLKSNRCLMKGHLPNDLQVIIKEYIQSL